MLFLRRHWDLVLFILVSTLVFIINFQILQPVIEYQLIDPLDDWVWLAIFKSYSNIDLIPRIAQLWLKLGLHEGAYAIHVGLLGEIFGNDYEAYNYANIFLKALSAITLFPLILVVFKNRLLAALTTILYSITSATTGSLYWIMKGNTYLGGIFMNLFLLTYYLTLEKKTKFYFLASTIFILLASLTSIVRIYPVFVVIVLLEFVLLINKKTRNFKSALFRLAAYFLPTYAIASQAPISPNGFVEYKPFLVLRDILNGNLHDLLSPIAGVGYSFFTNHYWPFFGVIGETTFISFGDYLRFILVGPLIIFSIATAVISFGVVKTSKSYFARVLALNIFLQIAMYFVATFHFNISKDLWFEYDPGIFYLLKYPTLVGLYALSVSVITFFEWRKEPKKRLLMALWLGPPFALLFSAAMWITLGFLFNAYSSTGYYFTIPAIGMCLFVSAILVLLRESLKSLKGSIITSLLTLGVILVVYITSSLEISRDFTSDNPEKVTVKEQQLLHAEFFNQLGDIGKSGNLLVYFILPRDLTQANYYKRAFFMDSSGFSNMMSWRRNNLGLGCVAEVNSADKIASARTLLDGRMVFYYRGACVLPTDDPKINQFANKEKVIYELDDIRAFKIVNGEIKDVTKQEVGKITQ